MKKLSIQGNDKTKRENNSILSIEIEAYQFCLLFKTVETFFQKLKFGVNYEVKNEKVIICLSFDSENDATAVYELLTNEGF